MDDSRLGYPKALSDAVDAGRIMSPAPAAEGVPPAELPEAYGSNRLTLLVRDPDWLFAFWELASPAPSPLWLDVRRVGPDGRKGEPVATYAVGPSGRFHLPVPFRAARYVATLRAEGEPFPRLTSNAVTTPPGQPSSLEDEAWLTSMGLGSWPFWSRGSGFSPGFEMARRGSWLAAGPGGSPLSARGGMIRVPSAPDGRQGRRAGDAG